MATINLLDREKRFGRFGNHFFRNMGYHFISEKAGFVVIYGHAETFERMGITFYVGDRSTPTPGLPTVEINGDNFMSILKLPNLENYNFTANVINSYFQTREFSMILYDHFSKPDVKSIILAANPYATRYGANNDAFVHVRLGDITQLTPGFAYYDKVLSSLEFTSGYISSDTITHPICKELIAKYKLTIIDKTPEETIQFASTCKHMVLSQGTFSWMMALFGYNTEKAYYPKIKRAWHGDIFVLPNMIEVDY